MSGRCWIQQHYISLPTRALLTMEVSTWGFSESFSKETPLWGCTHRVCVTGTHISNLFYGVAKPSPSIWVLGRAGPTGTWRGISHQPWGCVCSEEMSESQEDVTASWKD